MSRAYAEQRIKEALRLSKGNQTRARQQIMAWTFEDTKLLQALTDPHLSGIVAYNVERVASGRSERAAAGSRPPSKPAPQKKKDDFGLEILKALASDTGAVFGLEGRAVSGRRQGVSQKHIDALNKIATRKPPKKT